MVVRGLRLFLISIVNALHNLRGLQPNELTTDGAWSWFSDPRAIILDNMIYAGWVKSNGTVEAARFDLAEGTVLRTTLYKRLERDDHNNPAFVITGNGTIHAMYTRHSKKYLFVNIIEGSNKHFRASEPKLIFPFSDEQLSTYPHSTITYANPYYLQQEERLYCFGRWTGYKPNVMWSADDGATWSKSKVFIAKNPFRRETRPYCKYFSDGQAGIHIIFTDDHPRNCPTNSVYYMRFENESFYRADGSHICDLNNLPIDPEVATVIYRATESEGRAWIADVSACELGHPVVLYTKSPNTNNHQYWYGRYTKEGWINRKICDAGSWFPQTKAGQKEQEPHYFGNMSIHPAKANVIYLSRRVNGVFEIERWETHDAGESWATEPVTSNSEYDNVRPYVPRGLQAGQDEIVLWMENRKYVHFTNFRTAIKYYIRRVDST